MRTDSPRFHQANTQLAKEPRHVVNIEFPTASIYCTTHGDISGVPGVVMNGVLRKPVVVSQRIVPDEGRSEIGAASFELVDLASVFTNDIRSKLAAGNGLRRRRVRFYRGFAGFTWADMQLWQTQTVRDASVDAGIYSVECNDITREQRKDVFTLAETTLTANVSPTDATINVHNTAAFNLVVHDASYSDAPSTTVGYFRIKDERIRYTGKTSTTFTGCTRGVFGTRAAAYTVDAGVAQDRREKVSEYVYLEGPVPKILYAIQTGILHGDSANLPATWHCGIDPALIRLTDYTAIGPDLWVPGTPTLGVPCRFEGLTKTDGKRFIEHELLTLIGCFQPVYADGSLGLKRATRIFRDAAPIFEINESNSIQIGALQHDMESLHNDFRIHWSWNGERYIRSNILIDQTSINTHGRAPLREISFKGLHGSIHTDGFILKLVDSQRDRYAGPPERMSVQLLDALSRGEVGDVVRARYASVRDYAGAAGAMDRAFEIQQARADSERFEIELFGSTATPSVQSPTSAAAALPDAFYPSQGTALASVPGVTIAANILTAAPGTPIGGNADLNNTGAIFYHDGPLTIAVGVNLLIASNWQLRVRGFLQINGTINGQGGGLAGVVDNGSDLIVDFGGLDRLPVLNTLAGAPGYVGNSRGMEGVIQRAFQINLTLYLAASTPTALTESKVKAAPDWKLQVSGNSLLGLNADLRGTGGAPGGRVYDNGGVASLGGTGGAGGAGLCIICRGMAFGASGQINLRGNDAAATSQTSLPDSNSAYAGAGGAGGPGTLYVLLDGAGLSVPSIGINNFLASTGTVPVNGTPIARGYNDATSGNAGVEVPQPMAGVDDGQRISALDHFNACQRVQYVPAAETANPDVESRPPAPTNIGLVVGSGFLLVTVTPPTNLAADQVVRLYASITNNRPDSIKVGEGRQDIFQVSSLPGQQRWFWATVYDPVTGLESDFFPSTTTSIYTAAAIGETPGGFLDTFEHQRWEALYNNRANGAGLVVDYPANGDHGGRVLRAAGALLWIAHKENVPFDPTALYRITAKVRRTAAGGGTGLEYAYVGVEGVAADGTTLINEVGGSDASNQHYNCFRGFDLSPIALNQWVTAVGYFKGHATSGFGVAAGIHAPTPLRTGVRYFRPLTILNFNGGNGTQEIDHIQVDVLNTQDVMLGGELTNESVALPADANGNVITYAGASGTFVVRYGTQTVAASAVAFAVVSNPQALTVSIDANGAYSVTGGLDANELTASVVFSATFLGAVIQRTLSVTKANQGAANWTAILSSGMTRNGQTFTKASGTSAWDSAFHSQEGYEGCFVTFRPSQNNLAVMVGLNTDPAADHVYTSLDFAWYPNDAGTLQIYENGVLISSHGAYSANEDLTILYDRVRVSYYRGTTLVRSVVRIGARLFVDSSFFQVGAAVNSVSFGPMGPAGLTSGNLLRLDAWTAGALTATIGNFTLNQSTNGENAIINGVGPYGHSQLLWECQCVDPGTGTGGEANGGWNNSVDLNQLIDATKTYRSTVWVRVRGAVGANQFYHGCGTASDTVNLDGSANSNPYFNSGLVHSSNFELDQWYLSVGIIHGSGYTGGQSGLSGLWDPRSGRRVVAGTDFRMASGARTQNHRAYMYYGGNTTTRQDLADPRFEVVDGTEPTFASLLVPPDADNTEKRRMIPDAEFSNETPAQHWQVVAGSGSGNVTFSPSGGLVGGRAILTWGSTGTATELRALRTPPYQPVGRARVHMRLRIQRTASLTGDLVLNVEAPQWDGGSNYNTGNLATIVLNNTTLPAASTWVEFTASVSFLTATASRPYATIRLTLIPSGTTNGQSVELDAFVANVEPDTFSAEAAGLAPKTSASPVGQQFLRDDGTWQAMNTDHLVTDYADDASTSYTLGNGDAESIRRFTSSSAITITLPNSIPTGWAIGDSMGIIRGGTGTLTFSTAGTLRSEGGSTITVQNGKACVTLAASGVWELSGRV